MQVDRCICTRMTFEQLKAVADAKKLDLEGLKSHTKCCMSCGLCEPFVKLMLRTGKTSFVFGEQYMLNTSTGVEEDEG